MSDSAASRHPLETADCFRHGEFDARLFRCPMCAAEREDADEVEAPERCPACEGIDASYHTFRRECNATPY